RSSGGRAPRLPDRSQGAGADPRLARPVLGRGPGRLPGRGGTARPVGERDTMSQQTQTITPAPIRKSFTVRASREGAWDVFTAGFGKWGPKTHYIGPSPLTDAAIEPKAGGRWYGLHEDGVERPWGRVLVWDPPARLVLDWQIDHEFGHDPDMHSDVE